VAHSVAGEARLFPPRHREASPVSSSEVSRSALPMPATQATLDFVGVKSDWTAVF